MNEVTTPSKGNKNVIWLLVALAAIAILAIGGYLFYQSETEMNSENEAVALVDGQAISESDYNRSAAQISSAYTAQGIDTANEETNAAIREQALNTLINRQLVLNAAAAEGTTVNDEAVETQYQTILSDMGGEENLSTAIASSGVTLEQFRQDLEADLIINAYLDGKINADSIAVSDEEVRAYYDQTAESETEDLPPFEDVAELIRQQLVNEAQQAAIAAELDRLRADAEIEVLI